MANTTNFGWETPDDTDLVKDGAAAIRTLAGAIDTSLVDLKGGTTGQVLAKNSNTDMDFVWSADASGIPATIFDAKGDLIVASAADTAARLAVGGTNGHVLTVNSGATNGIEWAAVGTSATSFSLLNSGGTSLSGTTTTISSLSGYNKLLIAISLASSNSGSAVFDFRLNADSTTKYNYFGGRIISAAATLDMVSAFSQFNNSQFEWSKQMTGAGDTCSGYVLIDGANSSGAKVVTWASGSSSGFNRYGGVNATFGGYYVGTSVIDSFSLLCGGGSFDQGEVFIYGGN